MKQINEEKINNLLADPPAADSRKIDRIINKSKSLKRLTLEESAILLACQDAAILDKIFSAANFVKEQIYGPRVVLFAPLYISNFCCNNCAYCAFKSDNRSLKRKALNTEEIKQQTAWLLERGHKRILMVASESAPAGKSNLDYYSESIAAIYAADFKGNRIKRVNVNCAPLTAAEFRKLKNSGIGTYQLFQETYQEATYLRLHPGGPKSDPDNRIDAVDRAFAAGIDDIGIGVLYGLYDYKFETLAMLAHIEYLEAKFKVGPHTISVPRVEPAQGAQLSFNPPYKISDAEFKKVVAVLRLSVPYTGIIMSTREDSLLRDTLLSLGVSQISAESCTSPGGYAVSAQEQAGGQFSLGDRRSLDEIVGALISHDYIPSFCAACYRMKRTGESFMRLARPGTIKGKCRMNALITLKEYLDDFASAGVRAAGDEMIARHSQQLDKTEQAELKEFFSRVEKGLRDEYV